MPEGAGVVVELPQRPDLHAFIVDGEVVREVEEGGNGDHVAYRLTMDTPGSYWVGFAAGDPVAGYAALAAFVEVTEGDGAAAGSG